MEADEVGSIAELGALTDEHFLDELEAVDDDARRVAQSQAVDIAVCFGKFGQALER